MNKSMVGAIGVGLATGILAASKIKEKQNIDLFTGFERTEIVAPVRGTAERYPLRSFVIPQDVIPEAQQFQRDTIADSIVAAWQGTIDRVLYWQDYGEFFKYPRETWDSRLGDCEDSAILLTSIIRNYMQHVYVAIGFFLSYGHSWTVVSLPEGDYVIESTLSSMPPDPWLIRVQETNEYVPYIYFNNDVCWMKPGYSLTDITISPDKQELIDYIWGVRNVVYNTP